MVGNAEKEEEEGTVWTRVRKDRKSRRTLAEGYFLQWKDAEENKIEQNRFTYIASREEITLQLKVRFTYKANRERINV